jgi:hypothetical protein
MFSLEVWLRKAESSDVTPSIPQCSLFLGLLCLCRHGFMNAYMREILVEASWKMRYNMKDLSRWLGKEDVTHI